MAVSLKQRKALGRRYSTDPAISLELARLEREYNLAPGREARGMQASQFAQSLEQNKSQQAQQESQYQRSLAQSEKNSERQAAQFEQQMAAAEKARQDALDQANRNYQLALQNAKDDKEYKQAALDYQKAKDAADRAYMADRDKSAQTSGMYSTVGNLATTGAMIRAATMQKGESFFGGAGDKVGGMVNTGVTKAKNLFSPNAPNQVDPYVAPAAPTSTIAPSVAPSVTPVDYGGGIESGAGFGGQIGGGSAYGGGVTGASGELYGGVESGLGFAGEIGAETGASTWGTMGGTLGNLGSGISTAAPYYALAKAGGMGINAIVNNNQWMQNTPFSRLGGSLQEPLAVERYWANQAADIGIGDSKTNTMIADVLNPVGWLVNRTWICTEIDKEEPLSEEVNEFLSKLRRYAIKKHKKDARAYLKNGFLLIESIDLDLDSLKKELVEKCCDLVKEGKLEEAFNHYKEVVIKLCDENGFDVDLLYEEVE